MNNRFLYDGFWWSYDDLIEYVNGGELALKGVCRYLFDFVKNIAGHSESVDDILYKIITSKKDVIICTSGTTDNPKILKQKVSVLLNGVRMFNGHENDVWGLTYTEGSIALLHVFLQGLMNKNSMVIMEGGDTWRMDMVTHISATPTFYRMIECRYPDVKQVTIGGEVSNVFEKVGRIFPNAKVKNIYATSEHGSLLVSDSARFSIPERLMHVVEIIDNEIVINGDRTGDMVEFVDGGFIITHRECNVVNVGGHKVNLIDIENATNSFSYVAASRAYGRKNSLLGHVVCLDVLLREGGDIKKDLSKVLKKWQMPSKINIVDSIQLANNKIKR